jgi:hypothetical protein
VNFDNLPKGWQLKRLGKIANVGVPTGFKPRPVDGKVPFIEMAGIDEKTGLRSKFVWKDYPELSSGKVRFMSNAILVGKITP